MGAAGGPTGAVMGTFALIYSGGSMAQTPEEQQAVMQAWNEWFGTLGDSVVQVGNPFGASASVSGDGVGRPGSLGATGYSVIRAGTLDEATGFAKSCPIIANGGAIDVYEAIEM
jgi:hypothetical protein